ncbi:MAG: phosphoribosylaminoimidazolesuccinocarboxamide synthase [Bacteroidetes bacterium]|nr:phosphoribosylaminoimidazolesuccinocarboxamide synthase [Bacteroidota bacterium]MBK7569965.1 phosphoribosylaminoimidazolesuccinocarboxamide synthase [Bacteroidota bacterium]MBP8917801.1 phosphoribosylaminoimidazolesuccinocarboxamide synthase [Chitinophagales bacterium]
MSVLNTDLKLPGANSIYHGKVRDVYTIKDKYLVMVASDRISAFDVILPHPIPFKGQVLNQLAAFFLEATKDIAPNWLLSVPDPRVSIGIKCLPVKVEMVIRGYLAGHAWREYKSGKRMICGVLMPDGLKENDKFPEPIITPTSKADAGHDEDISKEDILKSNIITPDKYELMEYYTRELFKKGTEMAKERGLILVDTKYEFGLHDGKILLMDEIHTPDSSRYFYLEGYAERQINNEHQKQLSKEFVREWLIENNFMGKEGQTVPEMGEEWLKTISSRYIELYEMVTGKKFIPVETNSESISSNIINGLKKLGVV